jgi:hypothetical protein
MLCVRNVENHTQMPGRCAPLEITSGTENIILQALVLSVYSQGEQTWLIIDLLSALGGLA